MELIRLYQGYPINKNQFFAPSLAKRSATPGLKAQSRKAIVSKNLLQRFVTPTTTNRTSSDFDISERNIITRDNLSYHLYRNSQLITPVPKSSSQATNTSPPSYKKYIYQSSSAKKRKFNTFNESQTSTHKLLLMYRKKNYKKSCDVAIQNASFGNLMIPAIKPESPFKDD